MFKSKFLEGCSIRNTQQPLELPLPDDDPSALTVFLHTLHFSAKRSFSRVGVDLQLEVAKLADKYDCTTAINGDSGRWLRSLSEDDCNPLTLSKLSAAACLLGHTGPFSDFTAKLAVKTTVAELYDVMQESSLSDCLKGLQFPLWT